MHSHQIISRVRYQGALMTARTAPVHTEKTMCRVSPTRITPRVPSVSLYALFQTLFIDLTALLMVLILIAAFLSCLVGLCDLRIRTLYNQAGCSVPSIDHRVIVCQPCSSDVCHKEGKLFLFWLVEDGRTGTGSAAVASTVDKEGLVATSGAVSKERF